MKGFILIVTPFSLIYFVRNLLYYNKFVLIKKDFTESLEFIDLENINSIGYKLNYSLITNDPAI